MFPGEIAGDRKQVRVHISDGFRIFYPEHPSVDLLGQIRGVCLASKASREKSLQSTVVSCKQPLEERFFGVFHFRPALRRAICHHSNIYRVPGPATGHRQFDSTPNYSCLRVLPGQCCTARAKSLVRCATPGTDSASASELWRI